VQQGSRTNASHDGTSIAHIDAGRMRTEVPKTVLSRKGFDGGSGGGPSPVVDGLPISLPIPEHGGIPYENLTTRVGVTAAQLISDLHGGRAAQVLADGAHLDPDLDSAVVPRLAGWRASLGQAGAAAGHLRNFRVGPGDLFLFWGLFREAQRSCHGRFRWVPGSRPYHAVFGHLTIGEVIRPDREDPPDWLAGHPHVSRPDRPNNVIFVAAVAATAGDEGASTFRRPVALSAPGGSPSQWLLPAALHPDACGTAPTYHASASRWRLEAAGTRLQTVGRGQEFVVQGAPWNDWARRVIAQGTAG